jgi:hypothetical protein
MKLFLEIIKDYWQVVIGFVAVISLMSELTAGQKALASRVDQLESISRDVSVIRNDVSWLKELFQKKGR